MDTFLGALIKNARLSMQRRAQPMLPACPGWQIARLDFTARTRLIETRMILHCPIKLITKEGKNTLLQSKKAAKRWRQAAENAHRRWTAQFYERPKKCAKKEFSLLLSSPNIAVFLKTGRTCWGKKYPVLSSESTGLKETHERTLILAATRPTWESEFSYFLACEPTTSAHIIDRCRRPEALAVVLRFPATPCKRS